MLIRVDGLVFYDQFGRLATYQIVLVSLGVLVLLVGVWVVSAIQPTGQGGVDLGTWVEEEEDEEMDYRETSSLLGNHDESNRRQSAPPLTTISPISNTDSVQSQSPSESPLTYSQPRPHLSPPQVDSATNTSALPQTPVFMDSPTIPDSPLSTTSANFNPNARRRRRTRYGTLVPDFAPAGAPTGFSIGLGAASPGFVLRPAGGSFSHSHSHGQGRGRSRSEDLNGVRAIMRGEPLRSEEGAGAGVEVEENRGEAEVRNWEREEGRQGGVKRESWFSRLLGGNKGKIRLEEDRDHRDREHDGDAGDGD